MHDLFKTFAAIAIGIITIISAFFAVRKFLYFLHPLKIIPSIYLKFDKSGGDAINASITNRSSDKIYITYCSAIEARPIRRALLAHLKNPFMSPRLYKCAWYGTKTYSLLDDKPITLEPNEVIELTHKLNLAHPLAGFLTNEFLIQVKLSTGNTIRSHRLTIPKRWHFLNIKSQRAENEA